MLAKLIVHHGGHATIRRGVMGRWASASPTSGSVLMVGCEGSGKTLLCRQLERCTKLGDKRAPPPPVDAVTQPSVGVEMLDLTHRRKSITVREVGGVMQPVWHRYFDACTAVVLVADCSSTAAAAAAGVEWYNLLVAASLRKKPLMLLLNKQDDPHAVSAQMLHVLLRIPECEALHSSSERRLTHLSASALTGEGIPALLDWMAECVAKAPKE